MYRYCQLLILVIFLAKQSFLLPCQSKNQANSENPSTSSNCNLTTNQTVDDRSQTNVTNRGHASECTSLMEAILEYYEGIDSDADVPHHFFSLKDLIYSAIIEGSGELQATPLHNLNATRFEQKREKECKDLMKKYTLPINDTGNCTWTYTCRVEPLHFPSLYVEAVLTTPENRLCRPVRMESPRFERSVCEHDSTLPHWQLKRSNNSIVIGYK